MWEDVLSIVDDETGNDEGRLFVQDDSWDGSQYIRCHNVMLCWSPHASTRSHACTSALVSHVLQIAELLLMLLMASQSQGCNSGFECRGHCLRLDADASMTS